MFDFDGTLVDSSDIKQRAFRAAIDETLAASEAAVQHAYSAHGTLNRLPQLFKAFQDLVGREPDEHELEKMVATYGSFVQARSREVQPFDGMQEFLADHRSRYHMAVASNAPQEELAAACDVLGIDRYFDHIYGYPTSKEKAIKIVQEVWALPFSRIIYIGDRLEDANIAKRVSVPFCRFGPNELGDDTSILRTMADLKRAVATLVSP